MDITSVSKIILTAEDQTAQGFDSTTKRAKATGSELDALTKQYGASAAAAIKLGLDAERSFQGQLTAMRSVRAEAAAMQRALDTGGGNRDIARSILGTRGTNEIINDIRLINAALESLRNSANIGPEELARASEAARQKIAALRAEMTPFASAAQQAMERAAAAVAAFNAKLVDMQQARVSIRETQRALDTLGSGNRDIARAILGTRSTQDIANEIWLIHSALQSLKQNASVGPQELARASEAARVKLVALRAEMDGVAGSVTKAQAAFATLNMRSSNDIAKEIKAVNDALAVLKQTAGVGPLELARASEAAKAKVAALRAEITGVAPAVDRAAAAMQSFKSKLGGLEQARAEIANMQRTLDTLGGSNRDVGRAILGTRSAAEIQAEIRLINSALESMRRSAGIGPQEFARASEVAAQKVAALRTELTGISHAAAPIPPLIRQMFAPLAALATFTGIKELAMQFFTLADANTLLRARLRQTTGSLEGGRAAFAGLVEDARRLRAPLEEAGQGLTRIIRAVDDLGGTAVQARALNEIVLATAKISGAFGFEAAASARQFAQALGSGVLQGDELRSILENNKELANQLAAGLGVSSGELKKLGAEGKLTADVVANALLSRLPEIRAKLADVPITVADAFTLLRNEIFLFVGAADKGTGASKAFAGGMGLLADEIGRARTSMEGGDWLEFATRIGVVTSALNPTSLAGGLIGNQLRNAAGALNIGVKPEGTWGKQNLRAIEDEMAAPAEASFLGAEKAAKRFYDKASEAAEVYLTKQQKIKAAFGEQMDAFHKAIEAQRNIIDTAPAGKDRERELALERIAKVEKDRAAGMRNVVKELAEADAADAKRGGTLKELTAQQKAYNSALEQVANISAAAGEQREQMFMAENITKAEVALRKLENSQAWKILLPQQKAYLTQELLIAAETERLTKSLEEQATAAGQFASGRAKEYADWEQEVTRAGASVDTLVEKLEAEARALRSGGEETNEQAQALRRLKDQLDQGVIPSYDEYIKRVERLTEAFRERDAAAAEDKSRKDIIAQEKRAYADLYQWIDQQTTALWGAVTEKGKNAWESITEVFKRTLLAAVYKMAVQPIVFNIIASVTGVAAPGAGGAAGGVSSLLGGNSGGGLGSLLNMMPGGGGGILSSLGGMVGGAFGSALGAGFTAGIATLEIAAGAGVAAIGGLSAAMGAMAAVAIPVVGWIAAAGLLLYSMFGNKGGGPKMGGFASTGDIAGIQNVDNSGRWFTPNQSDAEIQESLATANKSYMDIAKALGLQQQNVGFALGFDTDPEGKAPNRIHAGAFVGGQQVYDAALGDLGRDEKVLQERLALESKRIIFAALQASVGDAPEYIRKLFEGVDVATVSSDQIDEILAMAQALKVIVDTVSGMGDKFAALSVDQIKSLVEAFGGLENFLAAAQFLNANFTTEAEKRMKVQEQLDEKFAELGIALPQTHADFLQLIEGLDLTDEAQQKTYASLMQLAPAFIALNGTADEAAAKILEMTRAIHEFNRANLLTDSQRTEEDAAELAATFAELGAAIPATHSEFLQLIGTLGLTGEEALALSELFVRVNGTAQEAADALAAMLDGALRAVTEIPAGIPTGASFEQRSDLTLSIIPGEIEKYQKMLDALRAKDPYSPLIAQYEKHVANLRALNNKTADQLARFTVLNAQYGAQKAEELVALEVWYAAQRELLEGNVEGLAALQALVEERWQAIVDGTADGVDGATSELQRLRRSIREFVDSLKLSDLSPLKPSEKLAEAQRQYQDLLGRAQGGDLDALAKLPDAAREYLTQAERFFARSTQQYNDIFMSVVSALEALAPLDAATPNESSKSDVTPIVSALPTNGRLASSTDIKELARTIIDGLVAQARMSSDDTSKFSRSLTNSLEGLEARSFRKPK